MFEFFHNLQIKKYSVVGGKGGYYGSVITKEGFFQPLDTDDALQADGVFNRKAKIYLPLGSGVGKEDKVTFEGVTYKVDSVTPYRATANVSHDKLIVTELHE